jgi:hypothetical protein
MDSLSQALRGANHQARSTLRPLESALVIGAGGVLGSALLAEALVAGRFQRVAAVVAGPLASTLRGLQPMPQAELQSGQPLKCEIAFLVFERERHANGRDDAFLRPEPGHLLSLAQALHQGGVRQLMVVLPHAPALLPHALKVGFASHDETAVAALGFDHVLFVRAAQAVLRPSGGGRMQRFADWWLSQLNWMVPSSEQPVRAVKLAQLVVLIARRLSASAPGTRVLPPEVLWQAAQTDEPELALAEWLHGPAP